MRVLIERLIKCSTNAHPILTTAFKPRFDALTSLRFYAAVMIVILHSWTSFVDSPIKWQLGQGVSFFFILSGFILSCVYPNLNGLHDIKHYLLARFVRIWPSHFVMTLLTLWLLPFTYFSIPALIINLLLLQAWVPDDKYYFSLNPVSWSLSCELFFYFCFIWLIRRWKFEWTGKIVLALGAFVLSCFFVKIFAHSKYHHLELDRHFFLGVNPIAHLAEFIVGMLTAKLWLCFGSSMQLSKFVATALEAVVIIIVIIEIGFISLVLPAIKQYPSLSYWLEHNGPTPLFALFIFVAAMQQGYLTKALINPISLWLGEISYSIYLVHFLLLRCFVVYIPEFAKLNNWLAYFMYWALVIMLSHLNFSLVEDPCRKLVKLFSSGPVSKYSFSKISNLFNMRFRFIAMTALFVIALITASAIYIQMSQKRFSFISLDVGKANFNEQFILEKICLANANDGIKIKLTWKSLIEQSVRRTVMLQFLDKNKNWLSEHNEYDIFPKNMKAGQIYLQTIYVPRDEISEGWTSIGLRLCIHQDLHFRYLPIAGEHTDFWNSRLVIPIANHASLNQML